MHMRKASGKKTQLEGIERFIGTFFLCHYEDPCVRAHKFIPV